MGPTQTGDLARSLLLQRRTAALKTDIDRLTREMSSGRQADPARAVGGNFARLSQVENGLAVADSLMTGARTAQVQLETQQSVLSGLTEDATAAARDIALQARSNAPGARPAAIARVEAGFADLVTRLNTSVGGRYVFAGVATDTPPLAAADTILDAVAASLPPGAGAADITQGVADWFAPGGGFDTLAYQGAAAPAAPRDMGDGPNVTLDLTALDPGLRESLAAFATGAVLSRGTLAADDARASDVLERAATRLQTAAGQGVALSARIGLQESRAEEALTQATAQQSALQVAQAELLRADPYETATALQTVNQKLEQMFAVTARLSQLSLARFLP